MFLGGWLPPFDFLSFIPGWIWLAAKTFLVVSMFIWIRATFPRFRYDQIMRLGWKIFIPVTLVWLVVVGGWMHSPWNIWKDRKSTRLNSSHLVISYAVFCLKK